MANTPESVNSFWAAYGDASKLVEVEAKGPPGSLAADVLATFNIPSAVNSISERHSLKNYKTFALSESSSTFGPRIGHTFSFS